MRLALAVFLLSAVFVHGADPVNADRLIYGGSWAGMVGVEGGIPVRTTIYTNVNAYTGSPATITTALNNCPSNQVVKLNAGTFSMNASLSHRYSGRTLRGTTNANGVPTTIIVFTGGSIRLLPIESSTSWRLDLTGDFTTRTVSSPTGASLRGATAITLTAAPTGMVDEQAIFFTDDSTGGDDFYGFGSTGGDRTWFHWARVTNIVGSVIHVFPPISADFLTGTTQVHYKPAAGGEMVQYAGVEDIEIQMTGATDSLTGFFGADSCWYKNVKAGTTSGGGGVHHNNPYSFFRCEIRHCEFYGQTAYGNSSYVINAFGGGSLLVIDNYFHDIANIMPMFGLHSSAFAYNYANAMSYDSPNGWLAQGVFMHGAFNDYNLFEGNWVHGGYNDKAAESKNTVWLRNRLRGYDTDGATGIASDNSECISLEAGHTNWVMAGNVLGENGFHITVLNTFTTDSDFPSETIYNLKTTTTNTFVRLGNYNTVTDGIPSEEAVGGGDTIATSYLFSSQPDTIVHFWPNITSANMSSFSGKGDATNLLAAAYRSTHSGADPNWAAAAAAPASVVISGAVRISGGVRVQ